MTSKLWIASLVVLLTGCGGRYEYVEYGDTHWRVDRKTNERCVWVDEGLWFAPQDGPCRDARKHSPEEGDE